MELTGHEKRAFIEAYSRYRIACEQVLEAASDLGRTLTESKGILATLPIAPQNGKLEHWNPEDAIAATTAFRMQAESHKSMAQALEEQADALKAATDIAVELIGKAREDAAEPR